MRTALGVSAGSEVVCSALIRTTPNGEQTTEYRVISADDGANTDLGDLVASAIELMTTQLPSEDVQPDGIAVAYRTEEQTQSIRSAVGTRRRDLQLVPESAAALTYLRSTGEVAQFSTIGLVDLGAGGLTVTVLDQIDGTVLESQRTTDISGSAIDELVYQHLANEHYARERGVRQSRTQLIARSRAAKEHLSTNDAVTIDHIAGRPLELTRADFDLFIADLVRDAAVFADSVFARAPRRPEMVAVIGGGANISCLRTGLLDGLALPILTLDEPEAVIAKGAALLADSAGPLSFPVVSMGSQAPVGTFTKVAGALIGAFVVVGLIVGYGVQALTPSADSGISPAGTSNQQTTTPLVTVAPTTVAQLETETIPMFPSYEYPESTAFGPQGYHRTESTTTASTSPSTTSATPSSTTSRTPVPTLRPAPDLPLIPWPEIQKWLPQANPPEVPPAETVTSPATPAPDAAPPAQNHESTVPTTQPPQVPLPRPGSGSAGG